MGKFFSVVGPGCGDSGFKSRYLKCRGDEIRCGEEGDGMYMGLILDIVTCMLLGGFSQAIKIDGDWRGGGGIKREVLRVFVLLR